MSQQGFEPWTKRLRVRAWSIQQRSGAVIAGVSVASTCLDVPGNLSALLHRLLHVGS